MLSTNSEKQYSVFCANRPVIFVRLAALRFKVCEKFTNFKLFFKTYIQLLKIIAFYCIIKVEILCDFFYSHICHGQKA